MNSKILSLSTESKSFYKSLFKIVAPIALQNLISAAVSSADVVMLGFVGQTAIASAALANKIQFVLFLFLVGISSGLIMIAAQYWGKKDTYSIETIFGIALKISAGVGFVFFAGAFFFPKVLMKIFTNDEDLIITGAQYLHIVSISYFVLSISQVFQAALKSTEHVKTVTAITTSALSLNIVLNAVFIFGLFGAPKLGIRGVALATSTARVIELILCILVSRRITSIHLSFKMIFRKNHLLVKDFFKYSMPAIGNESVWGLAFSTYSIIMGHLGADIVAANSVVNVVRDLASVLCFGMAYGGAILIGKEMGADNLDKAKRYASRLVRSTIAAGVAGAVLMVIFKPVLYHIAKLSVSASEFLSPMLYINCISVIGAAINTVIICGVFRAGGDAKFGFILDTIIMWGVSVPLGLICAFVLKLPPLAVYFVLFLDEWEKMLPVVIHYKNGKWVKNITRMFD